VSSSTGHDAASEALLATFNRGDTVYSLSFAGDGESNHESAFLSLIDDRMKSQLRNSYVALHHHLSPSGYDAPPPTPKIHDRLHPQLKLGKTVYSLSFAGESIHDDIESDITTALMSNRMKKQIQVSFNSLRTTFTGDVLSRNAIERTLPPLKQEDDVAEISAEPWIRPLPKLSDQITLPKLDDDTRPIVITDTKNPFHIVAVNKAWEDLCGYTREECQGKSLGELLQGPETELNDASIMLSKLLGGEEANAILTNYAKNGRKFKNHIRVGPIVDEMGKTVNFIGVLREVNDTDGVFSDLSIGGVRMRLPFVS
jgi:PAS domain S-box-containing protein